MAGQRKIFLFYLVDTPTGNCYYLDANRHIQKSSLKGATTDISLNNAPDGWMQTELGFIRNTKYYGINRSFTLPMKLVKDAAFIIRSLAYKGQGIETQLSIVIYKYNELPQAGQPTYQFYYKGALDIPKMNDLVAEGVNCALMEGGAVQYLKSWENVTVQIPMDGSIQENIKAELDGLSLQDTLFYEFVPIANLIGIAHTAPLVYIDNDGDNIGVIHGNQIYDTTGLNFGAYVSASPNFTLSFQAPTKVRIYGTVTAKPSGVGPVLFGLIAATSLSQATGGVNVSHSVSLVQGSTDGQVHQVSLPSATVFNFDETISLAANENLFIMVLGNNGDPSRTAQIVSGNIAFQFTTQYPATRPWGMSLYDAGRLLIDSINKASTTTATPFNIKFDSQLLQKYSNVIITSGDALRASGDPNYNKFYNAIQTNPNFPNINEYYSYGPVMKLTLAKLFEICDSVFCASLSNQILAGENESLFIEARSYVFDDSTVTLEMGELVDVSIAPAMEYMANVFRIGYQPQTYDQKAGKYEYNTTLELQLPFKSFPTKKLEAICPARADSYGIERVRANINATSTTRNDSDDSLFLLNIDTSQYVYDFYSAQFISTNQDQTNPLNTNIKLIPNESIQSIPMSTILGDYFSQYNNPAIFVFNQSGLSAHPYNLAVSFSGFMNGNPANALAGTPADTCIIKMWINGAVIKTWTFTSGAASTPISGTYSASQNWSYRDAIYFTIQTSATCTATLTPGASPFLTIGSVYWEADIAGNQTANPGTALQLISLANVTSVTLDPFNRPVVSYGFQYFLFNSFLVNSSFNLVFNINGVLEGSSSQSITIDMFLNGQLSNTFNVPGVSASSYTNWSTQFAMTRSFQFGDVLFFVASETNINGWIQGAMLTLTSTQIKAYLLKRVQYGNLTGVPNLLGNLPNSATPITTGAGAPYNIEQLTPKRLFNNWAAWISSLCQGLPGGVINFSTLSKNQFLNTTTAVTVNRGFYLQVIPGVRTQENANIDISSLPAPMFLPWIVTAKTRVGLTFSQIQTGAANGHCHGTYNGMDIYGYPMEMKQKPALNEMQMWKILLSPKTDLTKFINLNIDGLTYLVMGANSIFCPFLSSVQCVPEGVVIQAKYHTPNMDQAWFSEQVAGWINQNNYWNPWMTSDSVPLQFITNGLSPVTANLYTFATPTPTLVSSTPLTLTTSNSVISPYQLWIGNVPLTGLTPGGYYIEIVAGTGVTTAKLITEGLNVQTDWPGTIFIEYTSTVNRQAMVFDTGFTGNIRVLGFIDNRMKPKYKGAFYVDQPQDIQIINAIPYQTQELWITGDEGVPDYLIKKIARIMLLDTVMIEGVNYSIEEGAEWEETFIQGNPKKFWKIDIRQSNNVNGVTANASGVDTDASMLITLDANPLGPNAGNVGTQEPDIISAIVH